MARAQAVPSRCPSSAAAEPLLRAAVSLWGHQGKSGHVGDVGRAEAVPRGKLAAGRRGSGRVSGRGSDEGQSL